MKRHARIITAVLSVMLTVTAFSVTAHAEDIGGDISYVEPQPQDSYVEPQPQDSYVDPQPQDSYVDPQPQDSYVEPDPQYSYVEPDPQTSYEEPYEEPYSGEDVYYDSDGNTYSDYSEMYVGGDQTYTPPMSTAPSAPLFDTSKTKVDENTLSSSDWNDIKAKLSGASGKSSDNGGDFAFIQNNDSAGDNGHMILILGFTLVALSIAGFAYLIISAVVRRKQTALAHAGKAASNSSGGSRYRTNSDYDDDFGGSGKKPKNGKRYK